MIDHRVERMKIWERGPMNCKCKVAGVRFISDSTKFSLGSFGALYKTWDVKLSKGYCPHSFHPILTKLNGKYGNQGQMRAINFLVIWQKCKNIRYFDDNLPQLHCHFQSIQVSGPRVFYPLHTQHIPSREMTLQYILSVCMALYIGTVSLQEGKTCRTL